MTVLAEPRPGRTGLAKAPEVWPPAARLYLWLVVATGAAVLAFRVPMLVADTWLFLGLALLSALASGVRLRLPVTTTASNLSMSYAVDFAALLLMGRDPATGVAAVGACLHAAVRVSADGRNRHSWSRLLFDIATRVLTVQAAGAVLERFASVPDAREWWAIATPLMAAALAYYAVNTALVATASALSTGRPMTDVWERQSLGAGSAGDTRHRDEVLQLHHDAVTALAAAQRSEQRYALAAAGSNDGLWDWDIPANALYCSDRWKLMLGLTSSTPVARPDDWFALVSDADRPGLRAALDDHLAGRSAHFEHEYRIRHADGSLRSVLCRGIAVRTPGGAPVRMAGSQTDVTEWRSVQESLTRAARHDHLTGLPNRRLFGELLQRAMARGIRAAEPRYAVLFIDLDGFKLVNDSLGHLVGDQFLVAISDRLRSQLRPSDVLSRLGGDEFAVLIEDFGSRDEVSLVPERLQRSFVEPIRIGGRELYASASIGVVLGGPQYATVDDLLRDADIAMYRAKAAGRGGYQMFDPHMHASAVERLQLETELRHAVERRTFTVVYQPIVELPSSEICGLEAFVRWTRADGRVIGPAEFIPVAEETGLIVPLTYSVLHEVCQQGARWQRMFGQPLGVSVNISSRLFGRRDFVDEVERAIDTSGLLPGTLRLEITESTLLNESEHVHGNFERLRRIPVAMYLDDFGTGYSSLSFLQRFPVDALKLDRSFVARMGAPDHGCVIGIAIVKLAQELGMGLIAEGVETLAHAEQLLALGCPHAQGHLFSEPRTREGVEALLAKAFDEAAETAAVQSFRKRTRLTA
jgi:diguanylate cyclase (GGDEF)-like protein/PAS domain S-box-containing protein